MTGLCFNITLVTKWGVDFVRAIRRPREISKGVVLLSNEILKENKNTD